MKLKDFHNSTQYIPHVCANCKWSCGKIVQRKTQYQSNNWNNGRTIIKMCWEGTCYRYPTPKTKKGEDWCGEWEPHPKRDFLFDISWPDWQDHK